jgi:hypothetical protein
MGVFRQAKKDFDIVLLIAVIALGVGFIGWFQPITNLGCNQPVSLMQCGTASCLITLPQTTCSTTVTFPVAFISNPKLTEASWIGFNIVSNHPERDIPAFSTYFQSDNGETWTNMPFTTTEIYGSTNHETSLDSSTILSSSNEVQFFASCFVGSNSASATLRPEYLDANTGIWHELAQNSGFLDINFGNSFCVGGGGGGSNLSSSLSVIAPNSLTQGITELRIVGFGGGGVGDNPVLNNIFLIFFTRVNQTPSICVANISQLNALCPNGVSPTNPKTQMILFATINYPPVSGFEVKMNWIAIE